MDKMFQRELEGSLYLHRPLPLHREQSAETIFPGKHVTSCRTLFDAGEQISVPFAPQEGVIETADGIITITAPLRSSHWPQGAAPDGDYSNFGTAAVCFRFPAQDWRSFNRIRLKVRSRTRGARILHLRKL